MKLVVADCQDFYIGKTKRRLHDRKSENFKGIRSTCHASILADHVTSTGHNLKLKNVGPPFFKFMSVYIKISFTQREKHSQLLCGLDFANERLLLCQFDV